MLHLMFDILKSAFKLNISEDFSIKEFLSKHVKIGL